MEYDKFNILLAKKVIEGLVQRNMEGYYCATKQEALDKVLSLIPCGSFVSSGGSKTLQELAIHSALEEGDYEYLNPKAQGSADKMDEAAHRALSSDYFLMSSNAVTEGGELVNIDGYGNRVSALIFGPKNVIVVAGMNKVVPTLDVAISRGRDHAAPLIMVSFNQDGYKDFDALVDSAHNACNQLVITSGSSIKGRIKVVLVGENLGF